MGQRRSHVTVALGSFFYAFCSVATAPASPFEDSTLGGAVFTGPTHSHATSFYVNPAALGVGAESNFGTHFYVGGSLRLDRFSIARRPITDPDIGPESGPSVSATTLSPGGTFAVYNVGNKVSVGASLGMPMTENFIADQPELGYHVLDGHHRQISWVTLAASFQFAGRVYVGAGLALSSTELQLSFLRDTALDAGDLDTPCEDGPCQIENPDAAELYEFDVDTPSLLATQALSLSVGFVYRVSQDWWFGVGLRSPAGFRSPVALEGTVKVTPSPREQRLNDAADYTANAEVVYKLPQTVAVGLRGPLTRQFELVTGVRWQNFSNHDQFDIRIFGGDASDQTPEWYPRYRGMRDVLTLEAGVERATGRLRYGGRLRFETGATAGDVVTPLQVAGINAGLGVGAELRLTNRFVIAVSGNFAWFPGVAMTGSSFDPRDHLACVDSGYAIDQCVASAQGRALPTAEGDYTRQSYAGRLSFRYQSF